MAQVKERGEGGEERKETALLLLPPPPPPFIYWLSFHFSRGQNRESRSSVFHCSETKRKRRALKPISKCQERKCIKRSSKIKYLQIHKILFENVIFVKYRVQDVPAENSKKTSLLVCISKQAKGSDRLG